jgi:hypothetical protein
MKQKKFANRYKGTIFTLEKKVIPIKIWKEADA